MKRYLFLAIATACLAASCSFLEEDPRGRQHSDGFFSRPQDLDASLNSLYYVVSVSQMQNNHVGTNFLSGDDISTHPASNKQGLREFDQYDVKNNNSWMQSLWEQRFKVIKAANFIINNAGRTPGASAEAITQTIAQAHYWRAFSYFYLVTTWGPVPVMLKEEIDYNAPLKSESEIYSLILSDLKIAEEGCPVEYSAAPYFQNGVNIAVSKAAVKATMAYVYMCMAGWPLNRTEHYADAAAKALEVIEGVENGTYKYGLLDKFSDIHSIAHNRSNKELLLGIYYNRDRNSNASAATDCLLEMNGGWGDTNGEIKFWMEFPDGPRKEATYFPKLLLKNKKAEDSEGEEPEESEEEVEPEPEWVERDWWYSPKDKNGKDTREVVAPVFMKSVEGAVQGQEFDYKDPNGCIAYGEKTIQVIRLSQVYCWYAEAVGRAGTGNIAKAAEVLGKVGARAYADGQMPDYASMSYQQLAEAAYNEHGWEVAGYYWSGFATRSRDMFRMYRFKEHFEYRVENPLIEVASGVFRNEIVPVEGTWDDSKMYAPYPFTDSSVNPGM